MVSNVRQQITAATLSSSLYATYGFDSFGYPTYSKAVSYGVNKQDYRYSFNPTTGNPAYRKNYLRSLQESFSYDTLGRLTGVSGPRNLTTSYANSSGNILKKSHLADTISFGYGANAGPYAMTSVTAPNGLIPNVSQFVGYTSFEKVDTIFEAPYKARYLYNSENQRARMVVNRNDTTILTRWYFGSRYMKETSGTTTKEYTYLGGDAYSAPVVAVTQGGTTAYYYLLRDYLGNVTHVVNSSYGISGEYSYDAWGRRRSADDWSYTLDANDGELMAGRGFTGHEHLPWFNLINMNGRLYDPVVGRFLSPDPYVQSPDFTQNFNRYSYCLNNPLKYTDPEGEVAVAAAFVVAGVIEGGINLISNWRKVDNFWDGLGYFASGFVGGGLAVINPVLGGSVTSVGNTLTDVLGGNAPTIKNGKDLLFYAGGKILDGLGAAGSAQIGKSITTAIGSWFEKVSASGAIRQVGSTTGVLYGEFPEIVVEASKKSFVSKVGQTAAAQASSKALAKEAAKEATQVGQSFGKLGTVVENPGINIANFSKHGLNQAITRSVNPSTILNTVKNPLTILKQGSGNYLYLTREAAVVLNPAGRVVSTYPAFMFDSSILNILKVF